MKLGIAGGLTRSFIASPLTPLFLLAAFMVGLVALITLPREEEPQISVPMVDIHVHADGLKAEDAVKLVTEPLETIIKSIDGVEHVYSQTRDDGAMVTARFLVGTSPDAAILRVHEKVRANMDRIPVGIPEPLIVGRGIDDVAIVVLTLSPKPEAAAHWTADGISRVTRELQVELAKLDDIGLSYIVGEQTEEIRIEPDPEKLSLYGITLQQLAGKVSGANRSFEAGQVRDGGKQISIMAGQTLQSPAEIGNILITARDGRPVYVRDVARIVLVGDSNETRVNSIAKTESGVTSVPAVSLAIAKRPGTNAVVISEHIVQRLEELKGSVVPDDLRVEVTRNYGETANEKANELLFHLGLATISIVILVALAIGWREALVVAIVIPTTILLTLFAARIMGYTLNRVSLFALIFSIGILVDDAIVVIENIARHWAMKDGRSRIDAAVDAVAEVGNPTIVATLTVVAALLPMLFVSGLMGPYMSPIPANASAAMIFSFFVAVMVTPWLMMKFGSAHGHAAHNEHGGATPGGVFGRVYLAVARPVLKSKARSWLFLIAVGIVTLASLVLFYTKDVTVKLLPFDNKSELQVVVDLPEGASVETTDGRLKEIAAKGLALPEVISVQTYAGTAAPFNFNGLVRHYYVRSNPEMGDVQLTLSGKSDRSRTSHQIALDLRERLKALPMPEGTSVKVVEPPPGPPVLATLLAEIYGPDPETRRATAAKVREAFAKVPFVVDIDDSYGVQKPRLRAAIDQDNLEYHKVEEADVYSTLQYLFAQTTVGYSHRGGGRQPIPIRLSLPKSEKVLDERVLSTPVPANALPGGRGVVELGDVVRVKQEQSSFPIFRHNGKPAEMVQAELAGAFEAPVYGMLDVGRALDQVDWTGLVKPEVILHGQPIDESKPSLLWDGEWEVTWVTFRDMGAAFGVALLGIYILVVAQFKSFKLPLVILTPIPLTLIGIMFGHWIFGAAFTATSMIGFIALAGIIVRNSILLVDFVRHADMTGRDLRDVLLEAGAIRFKPILLTAIAAMIGAVVILADPIFQGLAISLLFGLASSTALTVIVIPAIYMALRYKAPPPAATPTSVTDTDHPQSEVLS
ncbi:efflux RND transporter permease subunit [Aestuariivirga sp.]|uniref:efflux RND transporter permease subunit n=1 Tax=Aestuariivirga sp. TaxID=2650926 RepID=UPI0039E66C94